MTSQGFDVARWRAEFPALVREFDGRPAAFLDGPAGSQVPRAVIGAVAGYLERQNANCGGLFATSRQTDQLLGQARRGVSDLLGVADSDEVVFGPNMTTLTLGLARALARTWGPGDEVVVTRAEHDANFTPWIQAAADAGATVRFAGIRTEDCTLDLDDLARQINRRTRLVAVGAASNAVGTIHPVARVVELAHEVGAEVFVDAVHYAPHGAIDVAAWGCDWLALSAYKFFGPHVGLLWGRRERLESVPVYKLRPPSERAPERWMTGTQNHEGIAGTLAAIDYLAGLGRALRPDAIERRAALLAAFEAIGRYERELATLLIEGLARRPGVRVFGIVDPARSGERVPTVSITHERHRPEQVASHLAARGIFVWHGNFYALPLTEALGLEPDGLVRIGLLHYNTHEEIERLLGALDELH